MIKILLILALFFSFLFAGNPYDDKNLEPKSAEEIANENLKLIEVDDPAENDINSSKIDDMMKESLEKLTNALPTVTISNPYFISDFEFDGIEFYCPALTEKAGLTNMVLVDNINYNTGVIECVVYELPHLYSTQNQTWKDNTSFRPLTEIHRASFKNENYIKYINLINEADMQGKLSEEAIDASEAFKIKLELTKLALKSKYDGSGSNYGYIFGNNEDTTNSVYLTLTDIIDAVVTMNTMVIDIPKTLEMGSLQVNPGYVINYRVDEVVENDRERAKKLSELGREINEKFSFIPNIFDSSKNDEVYEPEKSDAEKLFGPNLHMFLMLMIKNNKIINDVFMLFLFLVAGLALSNIVHYGLERGGDETARKNMKYKIAAVLLTSFTIIYLNVDDTELSKTYTDEQGTIFEVPKSEIQDWINLLSMTSNEFADGVAEGVIANYIDSKFIDMQASVARAKAIVAANVKYEKAKKEAFDDLSECIDIYDLRKLKNDHKDFFKYNDSRKNQFVPANYILENEVMISPYNTTSLGGFVKNKTAFEESGLSLNACFNIRKNYGIISNYIFNNQKRIDNFNDIDVTEKVFEEQELVAEKLWSDYFKYGYAAASFIMINESYMDVKNLSSKKSNEWSGLLLDFDAINVARFAVENSVLFFAIGGAFNEFLSNLIRIITDNTIGFIPFFGDSLSAITAKTAGITLSLMIVDLIEDLIEPLRNLWMFVISSIMFSIFFISKLFAYWLVSFGLLYAFAKESVEKVVKIATKTVIIFFQPLIFVFIIAITLFAIDFFSNWISMMIQDMVDNMSNSHNATEFVAVHFLKSAAKLIGYAIEFIASYQLLVNGNKAVTDFFNIETNDIGSTMLANLSQNIQHKAIKQ